MRFTKIFLVYKCRKPEKLFSQQAYIDMPEAEGAYQ